MSGIKRGTIIALCCAAVFGVYPAAVHNVYAAGGNPSFVMLVTTWVRLVPLLAYCLVRRFPVFRTPQSRWIVFGGGACSAVSLFGVFAALEYLPGPVVLIILYTHTLMLLFFMAWRGEARLDVMTVLTTIAALFGLTLVLDLWHVQSSGSLIGMALAFASAIATLTRLYAFGKETRRHDPSIVGAETYMGAAFYISLLMLVKPPHAPDFVQSGAAYWYLALACITMAAGTFGMFYGISLMGAFRWSLFLKLEPVFTALFSFLILGEILKPLQYLGMVIVLASLATYQVFSHLKATRAKALDISESIEAVS